MIWLNPVDSRGFHKTYISNSGLTKKNFVEWDNEYMYRYLTELIV